MSETPSRNLKSATQRFVVAFALFCSLITVPCSLAQATASQQEFLFAYKLMQRGDTAEAGAAFDAFLEKFPNDDQRGDALYFRALIYQQARALQASAELLAGATGSSAPKRVPAFAVQLLRGQVLTDLGQYDEALGSLEQIDLDRLPDNAMASVLLLRSLAYRGAGNFEASANSADAASKLASPVKARALLELARAKALGGDTTSALVSLAEALAENNAAVNPEAARYAGDLSFSAGQIDEASAYYTRVIEQYQTSAEFPAAVTGRMWADLQAGRNVAVVNAYKQFGESLPKANQAEAKYLVASAYQSIDQHALATQFLADYVSGGDDQPLSALALYKLAVSQFELARYTDMAQTVDRLEKSFPESPQQIDASFLLASADAKQGRAVEGIGRLNTFVEAGPDNPYYAQALLRRAALFEQGDELDAAAADLKLYMDDRGNTESPTVTLRYVDINHRLGNYDIAIESCDAILAASETMPPAVIQEAMYRKGEAQTRATQYREALATFDELQRDHPINPYRQAVALRRGLLLNQLGRTDESMAVLLESANDARLPTPQRVAALRIIAAHLRDTNRTDDSAVTLRRIEQVAGLEALQDAELLWLGHYEVERGEPAEAIRTLAVIDGEKRKLAGVEESEMLFTRGRAYFMLDDLENAHRSFFGVVALGRGFDLEARLFLARTEAKQGNHDAALIELSDLTKADDGRIVAESLYETGKVYRQRADLLRRRGDDTGMREALLSARSSIKRMVVLYLTVDALQPLPQQGLVELAEIADELGESDALVKELNELIRAFDGSPYAEYGRALLDQKSRKRPDDALVRLNRMSPEDVDPTLASWVSAKKAELEAMR
ncbi:MAG: tetratricopeptide repeat protein [Planctomycetota bacterium]